MTLERPTAFVSTGELPPPERVRTLVDEAYERFASVDEGKPSQVYPALAQSRPSSSGSASSAHGAACTASETPTSSSRS
jgi:hypothetical protein